MVGAASITLTDGIFLVVVVLEVVKEDGIVVDFRGAVAVVIVYRAETERYHRV